MACKVMGIVNVTPDSFSDGGKYFTPEEAVRRVKNLIADGADIIDIGAESTKPGATPLSWEEEWSRLEPVLTLLKGTVPVGGTRNGELGMGTVPISIDTYHPETAERAVVLGAKIINCVYEGTVPDMLAICAKNDVEIVIPTKFSGTVPADVPFYLDPMIGFGTTRDEDLELLRSISELSKRGRVLVGASRKRIVKKLTGEKMTGKNLGGNLGVSVWAAMNGASIVRVHDVKETVQAFKVIEALKGS
ncbi:MAG: dihydropteroate synthase [Kiritimatiellae bacterium]|nr:dihydropteroate synthase [Kiritimatiellia bacterium]